MPITIDKNINSNSKKFDKGIQSEYALIANCCNAINDPVKHKCKKIYMEIKAFLLDLIREIPRFEDFMAPIMHLEEELNKFNIFEAEEKILLKIRFQTLIKIPIIYNENTYANLLV